jgi:PHD/YefM family antitoxin component YafN of YafNO toxin-antitoxin module
MGEIQYLTDEQGKRTAALVPIEEWERIQAEMRSLEETLYLLRSERMRERLLESLKSEDVVSIKEARETLGI